MYRDHRDVHQPDHAPRPQRPAQPEVAGTVDTRDDHRGQQSACHDVRRMAQHRGVQTRRTQRERRTRPSPEDWAPAQAGGRTSHSSHKYRLTERTKFIRPARDSSIFAAMGPRGSRNVQRGIAVTAPAQSAESVFRQASTRTFPAGIPFRHFLRWDANRATPSHPMPA